MTTVQKTLAAIGFVLLSISVLFPPLANSYGQAHFYFITYFFTAEYSHIAWSRYIIQALSISFLTLSLTLIFDSRPLDRLAMVRRVLTRKVVAATIVIAVSVAAFAYSLSPAPSAKPSTTNLDDLIDDKKENSSFDFEDKHWTKK